MATYLLNQKLYQSKVSHMNHSIYYYVGCWMSDETGETYSAEVELIMNPYGKQISLGKFLTVNLAIAHADKLIEYYQRVRGFVKDKKAWYRKWEPAKRN